MFGIPKKQMEPFQTLRLEATSHGERSTFPSSSGAQIETKREGRIERFSLPLRKMYRFMFCKRGPPIFMTPTYFSNPPCVFLISPPFFSIPDLRWNEYVHIMACCCSFFGCLEDVQSFLWGVVDWDPRPLLQVFVGTSSLSRAKEELCKEHGLNPATALQEEHDLDTLQFDCPANPKNVRKTTLKTTNTV